MLRFLHFKLIQIEIFNDKEEVVKFLSKSVPKLWRQTDADFKIRRRRTSRRPIDCKQNSRRPRGLDQCSDDSRDRRR